MRKTIRNLAFGILIVFVCIFSGGCRAGERSENPPTGNTIEEPYKMDGEWLSKLETYERRILIEQYLKFSDDGKVYYRNATYWKNGTTASPVWELDNSLLREFDRQLDYILIARYSTTANTCIFEYLGGERKTVLIWTGASPNAFSFYFERSLLDAVYRLIFAGQMELKFIKK